MSGAHREAGPSSRPLRVAVQGAPGCFSHAAALEFFDQVELIPCRDFGSLFAAVEEGRADRGMVPVENALAGAVSENLDLLVRRTLSVVGEAYVRVQMCLVTRPGTPMSEVTAAGSHPVALRQCGGFFARHPGIRAVVSHDTAGAIRDLMSGDAKGRGGGDAEFDAAIGPALAAELYGAEILERGIEDHPRNFTRFLVVTQAEAGVEAPVDGQVAREDGGEIVAPAKGPTAAARPGEDSAERTKASLAFTLPHLPGALHRAIGLFAEESLDLTRLESRPIPGRPWEYLFFLDVRTGPGAGFDRALARLREMAPEVHLLGIYPEANAP